MWLWYLKFEHLLRVFIYFASILEARVGVPWKLELSQASFLQLCKFKFTCEDHFSAWFSFSDQIKFIWRKKCNLFSVGNQSERTKKARHQVHCGWICSVPFKVLFGEQSSAVSYNCIIIQWINLNNCTEKHISSHKSPIQLSLWMTSCYPLKVVLIKFGW